MIEYRVLKTIMLGLIDRDEQRDVLIRPGDATVRLDSSTIFFRRQDGRWVESTTVHYAIEDWVQDGSIEQI